MDEAPTPGRSIRRRTEKPVTPTPTEAQNREAPQALGDSVLQSQTLESVASAVNYHKWLTDLALPHLGEHPIELGSGLGDYAATWLEGYVPEITVTEVDPSRLGILRERFSGDSRVHVRMIDVLHPAEAHHSAFVAFNVLEHIPEVVMFVPAFQFAMSRFDEEVGHVRRYTKKQLREALVAAGLVVDEIRYVNIPGLLAWFVGMRLLKMTPGEGRLLTVWDRLVVPLARRLETRVGAPFGQSVFAVAHVPAS
jgi:hypothetical protein